MANIIQYQTSVQPNSAVASSSSAGTGMVRAGQEAQEGIQYALHGLNQFAAQNRLVKQNTYESEAIALASEIEGEGKQKVADAFDTRVKERRFGDFELTTAPTIRDHYSDATLHEKIAARFDGRVPPEMPLLVRKRLGESREKLIEETRLRAAKLNVIGDDITSEDKRQAFAKAVQSGNNETILSAFETLRSDYDGRISRQTVAPDKVPALLSDAAFTATRTAHAMGLESGDPLAFQHQKELFQQLYPFMVGENARAEAAAMKGDKVAFREVQAEKIKDIVAASGGTIDTTMAADLSVTTGLPMHEVLAIGADISHKLLDARKIADERADYGKKRNSEQALDDMTTRYLDAFKGDKQARFLRVDAVNKLAKAAAPGMTGDDRIKLEARIRQMEKDSSNVQTDMGAYAKLKLQALMNPHSRSIMDQIVYHPQIGDAEQKELINAVVELRKQFADDSKRKTFELATKTYELKSGMFSEFPETIAADAQVEVMRVLSEVVLKGESTDIPYIKQQWVAYQTNPTEFIDTLMVRQRKVAEKLTVQRGKEVFDGLRIKPDSPAMAREISKATFDTSTDEGKNAVKALQMYMNKVYPTAVQQQSLLQDDKDTKALKDASKQFERKK